MRPFNIAVLIVSIAFVTVATHAAEPSAGKMVQVQPKDAARVPYWLYLPDNYERTKEKLPVLIFLHGMGERGNDMNRLLKHGPPKLIKRGKKMPFIMIAPQCPNDGGLRSGKAVSFWWKAGAIDEVKNILDYEKKRLGKVDDDRVYVTGLSMGGFGCYHIVSRHPNTFAAVAPICGHGKSWPDKKKVAHLPFWAFHGAKDRTVKLADQQKTVDALKAAGASVKFTIYPNAGHDSWSKTYDNPELYKWFLSHKRKQATRK